MPSYMSPPPGDAIFVNTIDPSGTTVDETVRMNSILAFWARKRRIVMQPGIWRLTDQGGQIGGIKCVSGTDLTAGSGVTVRSVQTKGLFLAFCFQNIPLLDNGAGVLSAATTIGSYTISSSITQAVGTRIWLGQTAPAAASLYVAQQYIVRAVAGAGPFTLTLDRPVLQPFAIGTRVQVVTQSVEDVVLNLNGCIIEGECDRLIQLQGAWKCKVNGPCTGRIGPTGLAADYMMSWDLASFECEASDLNAEQLIVGFAMESCERVVYRNCNGEGLVTAGMRIRDSVNVDVIACSGSGYNGAGLDVRASDVGVIGCYDVRINGGRWDGTTGGGALVGVSHGVATDCVTMNVYAAGHLTNFSQATTTIRPTFANCVSSRAGTNGFQIVAPHSRWTNCVSLGDARGWRIEATAVAADCVQCQAWDYTVVGIRGEAGTAVFTWSQGLLLSAVNGVNCTDYAGPDVITHTDSLFSGAAGGPVMCFFRAGAQVATWRGCEFRQTSGGTAGITAAAGNTFRLEGRNDFTGVTTPVTIPAGAFINRFLITLTAAVPLVVPWPDLKINERPVLTRTILAGGTGLAPLLTVNPGVDFTVTGPALDLDTYFVQISP